MKKFFWLYNRVSGEVMIFENFDARRISKAIKRLKTVGGLNVIFTYQSDTEDRLPTIDEWKSIRG